MAFRNSICLLGPGILRSMEASCFCGILAVLAQVVQLQLRAPVYCKKFLFGEAFNHDGNSSFQS